MIVKSFNSLLFFCLKIDYNVSMKNKFGDKKTAKSIKSRLKRLEYIYDNTCKKLDYLHKDENICGFKCNKCIVQQKSNSEEVNGCCRTCRLQSNKGCTSSNLTCKLFYCDEIKKKYKLYEFKDLELLDLLSKRQKLLLKYDLFSSREEVLLDLYFGSLILSAIRLVFCCYKNSFYLLFKNRTKNFYGKVVILMTLFFTIMSLLMMPQFILVVFGIGIIDELLIKIIKGLNKQ